VTAARFRQGEEDMALKIIDTLCTSCTACEAECPNVAISLKRGIYVVNSKKCTECIGYFDTPQCAAVCPVDNTCVIDPDYPRYQARA
jgi:ferredoxin